MSHTENCKISLFFFGLFILLIESSTTHIDEQTEPPVEIVRRRRPAHINIDMTFSELAKSTQSY